MLECYARILQFFVKLSHSRT